ncbi:MAG: 2,3-bisphosphoglycerate-independent phosphoglycerate mutase [bacterium]|nr:2,3-bisphosphoglycerate-independent phosphoglycerate mutase [bacterium]
MAKINLPIEKIPTVLIILDGFGLADETKKGNGITPKTAPNIFGYMKHYAHTELKASGTDVGLFPGQPGNSEAGHLNIGGGRIVKQDLVLITEAINDGTFFKNEAFKQALFHAKKYNRAVHIFGLLTNNSSAHACPDHMYAMLEYFRRERHGKVYLHLFTDGRDSPTSRALKYLDDLKKHLLSHEKIATIMGRFYAMDRNKIWDRTRQAYEAIVSGTGRFASSAEDAIKESYQRGDSDEFIEPTVIVEDGKPVGLFEDNDSIYFINARSDRARQLTKAFVQPDFQKKNTGAFKRSRFPQNTRFVAMTDFGPDLPGIFTAFPSPDVEYAIAKAIGHNYKQLYISETEKYAHITYFINGGYAQSINGEEREVINSISIRSYAEKPAMNAEELASRIISYMQKDKYEFVCVNFPNADMLGHTGDINAVQTAVQFMDEQIKRIVEEVVENKNGQVIITADHGNAEQMVNPITGEVSTEHTSNPVPFIIIKKGMESKELRKGRLADVAPTVLKLMNLNKPEEMTGESLLTT